MLKTDDTVFRKFGELYFSRVYPGVVKGWHIHKKVTPNSAMPKEMIELVLYEDLHESKTKAEIMELFIGESNYALVTIPHNVWNGFKCIGTKSALVVNRSTEPYNSKEIEQMSPLKSRIPYECSIKWGE